MKTNEKNRVLEKVLQKRKEKDEELLKEEIEKIDVRNLLLSQN
jgi:hypothetical protein